jgi:DNA-binding GntR family transcriptional regulator
VPSVRTLAAKVGAGRSSVHAALGALVASGVIERLADGGLILRS